MLGLGERFNRLQEVYRKPDGKKWTNKEIETATGGFVTKNYVTNLKAGRMKQPGIDRLRAIAQAMGFPEELWLQRDEDFDANVRAHEREKGLVTLADKLNLLVELASGRRAGEPLTNREVSQLTFGRLSEEQVAAARAGEVSDLEGAQYVALSNVFGVDVSYWYARPGEVPPLDHHTMTALGNAKVRAIVHKLHHRPDQQKDLIISLLDQLEEKEIDPPKD